MPAQHGQGHGRRRMYDGGDEAHTIVDERSYHALLSVHLMAIR